MASTEPGAAQTFGAADGARLIVRKGNLSGAQSSLEALWLRALGVTGRLIVYKQKGGTWFVVSGYEGDRVFYDKTIVSRDRWASFSLQFDRAQGEI